jgi:nucleotide-binding universal stress UspA family protein
MIDPTPRNDPMWCQGGRESVTQRPVLLCAVADDDQASGLLTFATQLANDAGFGFVAAHVVDERSVAAAAGSTGEGSLDGADVPWELSEGAVRAWSEGSQLLRGLGVCDECSVVAIGDPCEQLIRIARECDAALVVVGTSANSRLRIAIGGSVSHELVARCDRPVVVVHHEATSRGTGANIVCGVDGDADDALTVARVAADLAARLSLPLVLVHVLEVHDHLHWETKQPLEALLDPNAREGIHLMLPILRELGDRIDVRAVVRPGRTARELDALAEEYDAALVVLGCRRLGPLRTIVEPGVPLKLYKRTRRPLVVVPLRSRDDR